MSLGQAIVIRNLKTGTSVGLARDIKGCKMHKCLDNSTGYDSIERHEDTTKEK